MTIPVEPGVPMPCNRYPECGHDCVWPDCVQPPDDCPDDHGTMRPVLNRRDRRQRRHHPNLKPRPPWVAADRTAPLTSFWMGSR